MLLVNTLVWIVWFLSAATLCDESVSGCEQHPCQNGGVCESSGGSSHCVCPQHSEDGRVFGGDDCTIALQGCDGNRCENGGTCSPLFLGGRHAYECACPAGYSGPKCQTSTAFSFETQGYAYVETRPLDPVTLVNITFSFRTSRPIGTLVQRRVDDLALALLLADGRLRLSSRRGQGLSSLLQELPENVADGRWHRVEALLGSSSSLVRLLDSPCTEGTCTVDGGKESTLPENSTSSVLPGSGTPVHQSLFLGAAVGWGSPAAAGEGWVSSSSSATVRATDEPAPFLGCYRDVLVDSQLVTAEKLVDSPTQANVTVGCSDRDRCEESPCRNRGRCVSQGWRSYACRCQRPYEGPTCAEEYITARFGSQDSQSYALFSLDDDGPMDAITVSLFVRTRRHSSLLLVLSNSTSQYLRLWLQEGRLRVQIHNFESLEGRAPLNDGHFHLVTVRLERGTAALFQSGRSQGAPVSIRPVEAQPGDLVYVGGLVDRRAADAFGGYFKGCIQDLRINRRRMQFFSIETPVASHRLEKLVDIAPGCTSDDACSVNPCLNGGVCYSMWDDFTCNCPPNTAGRRCEVVKWCDMSPCPSSAICQPLAQGFECASNVTLRGGQRSMLVYRGNGRIQRSIRSVLLRLRTRQTEATLLHAQRGSSFLTLSLRDSCLLLELEGARDEVGARTEGGTGLIAQSWAVLSDGMWHTVELLLESTDLHTSRWIVVLDEGKEQRGFHASASVNLDFLRDGTDIVLGGQGPGSTGGGNLVGCLGLVEIGGIPLPYHTDSELHLPRPQDEQFVRVYGQDDELPLHGCWGANVCPPTPACPCVCTQPLCAESFCRCPSGWSGPRCPDPEQSACSSSPCENGMCSVVSSGGYTCKCDAGFTGARCEVEVDVCADNRCGPGATCLRGITDYACLCPRNMTGPYCKDRVPEMPWYIERFQLPSLPSSVCVGKRWNYSCFNGGHCSAWGDSCDCIAGFMGQWCEVDVDECQSNPCENGGYCRNLINGFHCLCEINYSGDHCQIDINDFYFLVFLLMWQNVFQLMSYFVLNLDEGPEVEWEWER